MAVMQILESDLFTNELNIILSFIVRKESIKVKNTFKMIYTRL